MNYTYRMNNQIFLLKSFFTILFLNLELNFYLYYYYQFLIVCNEYISLIAPLIKRLGIQSDGTK